MGRRTAKINIEKRVKAGFGQGHGRNYKSWLTAQSFSSIGYTIRVPGKKTGREHHLFSNIELEFFHVLDWSPRVVDIREQFPLLPVDETLAYSAAHRIRHPMDPRTKEPYVLTTDFLVTIRNTPRDTEEARAVKPASALQSPRTLEKLQIERLYWNARNVKWGIVTEQDIPKNVSHNLRWLHPYIDSPHVASVPEDQFDAVDRVLRGSLENGMTLAAAARTCDGKFGFEPGVSLSLARYFIASRRWSVDISVKIDPGLPLKINGDLS
jgi:hypothetical protein